MPVVLAAFGESSAVRLVSGRIEELARRSIAGHPVALEISDMGTQCARRPHPAHDPRLDDGAAGAVAEEPRRGKARGAATPKRAAAPPGPPRERPPAFCAAWSACARKGFVSGRARRADAAWTDAKIVVSGSSMRSAGCRKLSDDNALPKMASCAGSSQCSRDG